MANVIVMEEENLLLAWLVLLKGKSAMSTYAWPKDIRQRNIHLQAAADICNASM